MCAKKFNIICIVSQWIDCTNSSSHSEWDKHRYIQDWLYSLIQDPTHPQRSIYQNPHHLSNRHHHPLVDVVVVVNSPKSKKHNTDSRSRTPLLPDHSQNPTAHSSVLVNWRTRSLVVTSLLDKKTLATSQWYPFTPAKSPQVINLCQSLSSSRKIFFRGSVNFH